MDKEIILLVDDEENVLHSIKRSLQRWLIENNLQLLSSTSVQNAINLVQEYDSLISVIISDQRMPVLRGSDLTAEIQKTNPDIPIIILSGHADLNDIKDIVASGAFSFIAKPWEAVTLQNEILKALEIHKLRKENSLIKSRNHDEIKMAAEFQKSILNVQLPPDDKISFKVTYQAVSDFGIGGDYYDIIALNGSQYLVLTGDVSGHGLKTSFLTAVLKSIIYPDYIRNIDASRFALNHFLSWLNKRMCDYLVKFPDLFITFAAALIDLEANRITVVNAGQPPVCLIRNESVLHVGGSGLVLGVDRNSAYGEDVHPLGNGEAVLFCSDGIYPSGIESGNYGIGDFNNILHNNFGDIHNHGKIIGDVAGKLTPGIINDDITLITALLA